MKRAVKITATLAGFAALALGLFFGPSVLQARTADAQTKNAVSYVNDDAAVQSILSGAKHTPATAGDFRAGADITHATVKSVVKVAR